jgi:hypothetical protein
MVTSHGSVELAFVRSVPSSGMLSSDFDFDFGLEPREVEVEVEIEPHDGAANPV